MNSLPQSQTDTSRPKQHFKGIGYLIGGLVLWVLLFVGFAGEPSWDVGQRLVYSFAAAAALTFVASVAVWRHVTQKAKDKAVGKPLSVKEAMLQVSSIGFTPTQKYISNTSVGVVGLALDENTGNVCFLQRQAHHILIEYADASGGDGA